MNILLEPYEDFGSQVTKEVTNLATRAYLHILLALERILKS